MFSLRFDLILIVSVRAQNPKVLCSTSGEDSKFFLFFHARDKTVTFLSFPFSYTNLSFLFKKQYCAKILRNKIHELFFHVILAASFPNIVDP